MERAANSTPWLVYEAYLNKCINDSRHQFWWEKIPSSSPPSSQKFHVSLLTHSAFFHHERNPWENSMPQLVVTEMTECFWPSCHLFRLFKKGLMGIHSGDNLLHKSDFKLTLKCSTQMMKEIIQDSFLLECLCAKSDSDVKRSI